MKKKEKINLKVPNENKNNSLEIHEHLIVYKDEISGKCYNGYCPVKMDNIPGYALLKNHPYLNRYIEFYNY